MKKLIGENRCLAPLNNQATGSISTSTVSKTNLSNSIIVEYNSNEVILSLTREIERLTIRLFQTEDKYHKLLQQRQ